LLIVRIWRKQNENMDPSCLVTTVQAGGGGVMVWGMFSWHTLGPLVPIGHRLNATAYLSIENVRGQLLFHTGPCRFGFFFSLNNKNPHLKTAFCVYLCYL
uniref:Uncharacterized protein n=1 Tax=Xenopus tropicalis TaxID=8364 RepID=A0A803KDR6_XENTR